jgi:hypothetical protein
MLNDAITPKDRLRCVAPECWSWKLAMVFIALAIVLALMLEARASDMPPFKLDHPVLEVNYVVLVPSSRYSCIAFGGSALQSAEDRLSAICPAWSLHRSSDGLPESVMGEFVPVRSIREARVGWRLGEQSIQIGGRWTSLELDFGCDSDYQIHLGASSARDSKLHRSNARKACDPPRQSDLRILLSESWVHSRRIYEGRFMGMADASSKNAARNTTAATQPFTLSHPLCTTGFMFAQRFDTRDRFGIIVKREWKMTGCAKGQIVYGRKV